MADRYAQCDSTCTVDCGACKGTGPPAPPAPAPPVRYNRPRARRLGRGGTYDPLSNPRGAR